MRHLRLGVLGIGLWLLLMGTATAQQIAKIEFIQASATDPTQQTVADALTEPSFRFERGQLLWLSVFVHFVQTTTNPALVQVLGPLGQQVASVPAGTDAVMAGVQVPASKRWILNRVAVSVLLPDATLVDEWRVAFRSQTK